MVESKILFKLSCSFPSLVISLIISVFFFFKARSCFFVFNILLLAASTLFWAVFSSLVNSFFNVFNFSVGSRPKKFNEIYHLGCRGLSLLQISNGKSLFSPELLLPPLPLISHFSCQAYFFHFSRSLLFFESVLK